jgi:hypothetical protein
MMSKTVELNGQHIMSWTSPRDEMPDGSKPVIFVYSFGHDRLIGHGYYTQHRREAWLDFLECDEFGQPREVPTANVYFWMPQPPAPASEPAINP